MFTSPFVMPETLHTTTVISVPVNDVTQMWWQYGQPVLTTKSYTFQALSMLPTNKHQ
jgi:hypothetical protein